MAFKIKFLVFTFLATLIMVCCKSGCGSSTAKTNQIMCNEVPENLLSEVLGGAFNSRYMSIKPPKQQDLDEETYKRDAEGPGSFYVEDSYTKQINEVPKWPWDTSPLGKEGLKSRPKRMASDPESKTFAGPVDPHQWHCESKLRWIDLGPNYFPRYLRSVECSSDTCWFTHFKCKPRSFTVKLLRRKDDRCVITKFGSHAGLEGLPVELKEMWMWEERAVNFCCDCAITV